MIEIDILRNSSQTMVGVDGYLFLPLFFGGMGVQMTPRHPSGGGGVGVLSIKKNILGLKGKIRIKSDPENIEFLEKKSAHFQKGNPPPRIAYGRLHIAVQSPWEERFRNDRTAYISISLVEES